jgi:hypothetical protein
MIQPEGKLKPEELTELSTAVGHQQSRSCLTGKLDQWAHSANVINNTHDE